MLLKLRSQVNSGLFYLASSAWFAYLTIVLLILKILWDMWSYKDFVIGDTLNYYMGGSSWHTSLINNIVWSPLYTAYMGSLMSFTDDAYTVIIAHRLIILLLLAVLVLALMRRLLPHSIAWLVAAWWVVLPVTFNALFEVHLFAVIPTLIAYIAAVHRPTRWMRGIALGFFVIATVLARNELISAPILWFLLCVFWEFHLIRKNHRVHIAGYLSAYGVPLMAAGLLIAFFYARSEVKFPEIGEGLAGKHTLNMCQIYANNYQQHYTDWTRNPWTECQELMLRDFGVPFPSMMEAVQRNPQAMLDFFLWNIRLIPDGIQVLLFGSTAGRGQPDYVGVTTGSRFALICSIGLITVVLVGLFLFWRERKFWWNVWLKTRVWGWLALSCVLPSMALVMIMPRPRPSYLFNLGLLIMALTGMCAFVILHRWALAKKLLVFMPVLMCSLIVIVPSYYPQLLSSQSDLVNRPILTEYRRLQPYLELITQPEQKLLGHTAYFLGTVVMRDPAKAVDVFEFVQSEATDLSFAEWIDSQGITIIYLDELVLDYPQVQAFLQELDSTKWQILHEVNTDGEHWILLQRMSEDQTLQPRLESMSRH